MEGIKAVNLITCEGETAKPTCAQGTIKVLSANYGRTDSTTCSSGRPAGQISNVQCTQNTTLSLLTTQCDGKQNCFIVVGNTVFTDPCFGTYKYLNVSYECILPPPPPPPPPPNQGTIKVLSANYGRADKTTCSSGRPAGQISNVQCTQNTTLSVLTTQCDGKQNCSVAVGNMAFTDPCPGTYKYLNVTFDCILPPPPRPNQSKCSGKRSLDLDPAPPPGSESNPAPWMLCSAVQRYWPSWRTSPRITHGYPKMSKEAGRG
ncbi:L-rhamnose-binding lectin CSL3-like [Paramisgurnus dabryanus]|uniref:L-rhamnose-binding lectin CSL3-like n=1 Tax=Paramisgurnus dabryanus TaxID=90735 RepID=UPI0031F3CAF4